MPRVKTKVTPDETTETITKAINPMDEPEKFKLSAIGTPGYNIFNGVPAEEFHRDLQWPTAAKTFKKMTYSAPINASLSLYDNIISKVTWRTKPIKDATDEELKQATFIQECLDDMDIPFRQVILDSLSANMFGFAIQEKVFRRRNSNSGSMYNDNKIALRKLSIRNQETIDKFIYDDFGEIVGVKQNLSNVGNNSWYGRKLTQTEVVIPRSKYMHVTVGNARGNPFGVSPLRNVYICWRFLECLSEMEASGAQRDLSGVPILKVPAQLMSADASPDQKAILENLKNIIRNLQANSQSGVIIPSTVDDTTRTPLFDISLLSDDGGKKNFDLNQIKQYYQAQIYSSLFCDIILMGSTNSGSFNLGSLKNSLLGTAVEAMLDNIVEAFNRDVIRHLYVLNGWDQTRACSLDYENLNPVDLDVFSRAVQRIGAVNLMPRTHDTINSILTAFNLDPLDPNEDLDNVLNTANETGAGEGMVQGIGGGTGDAVSTADTTTSNLEN